MFGVVKFARANSLVAVLVGLVAVLVGLVAVLVGLVAVLVGLVAVLVGLVDIRVGLVASFASVVCCFRVTDDVGVVGVTIKATVVCFLLLLRILQLPL